ncbi:MAG TPA: transglycosylase domain-containing protein [Nocardioidaceae bacterium]|nr:transglycosylase domain-containing protein [Nocardioidaceae bacterium]
MSPSARRQRLSPAKIAGHLAVMTAVSAVMGVLVAGFALPFAGVAGLGTRAVAEGVGKLPAELTTEPLAQRTRVLDSRGKVLATFFDENRVNVELDEVAPIMRKAIIAIEDYRFYRHGALDLKGTLRAFVTNQASDDVVQGGSSITQQMVKMTLIAQADTEEEAAAATASTYQRKLNELRYAIAFEEKYDKDWILQRYLNLAYFGDGAHGIQAASQHYFSRPASELELHQAALLAGLVKNPTGYDPTNDPGEAIDRRNVVLDRMAELKVVSEREAEEAKARGLGLDLAPTRNGCVSAAAPFFCDYVREYLLQEPALGKTVKAREEALSTGGLTIKSTVDMRMQRAADRSVRKHVDPTDRAIGGLAMVEPGTGAVRALAQSRPMGTNKRKGETFLNYVVPEEYGDANGFQAGSTFKAFVLAAAIDQGVALRARIKAPPKVSIPVNQYRGCNGRLQSTERWEPGNSTGSGTFNLYTGTQQSVNTFFARLELRTGLCQPYRLARQMGIDLDDPASQQVPSFTLGVANTNPLSMAEAYATFAARGLHCESRPVTEILGKDGSVVKTFPDQCDRVLRRPVADAVNDILRGVQEPGGFGHNAGLALKQPSAGKTGTINRNMAVWFVGYTPNLAAASMIAGANREGHWVTLNGQVVGGSRIDRAAGSTNAGPMWGDAMKRIQRWLPDVNFQAPDPRVVRGKQVRVPDLAGLSQLEAIRKLRERGLVAVVGRKVDSALPRGAVAYTNPSAGSTVGSGMTVTLFRSDGTPYVPPPRTRSRPDSGGTSDGGTGGSSGGGGGSSGGGGGSSGGGGGSDGPGNGNGYGRGGR